LGAPTALLFEQPSSGLCILTWIKDADFDPVLGIMRRVVRKQGAVVFLQSGTDLGHPVWWPFSFQ
jgi:hypothetical protein